MDEASPGDRTAGAATLVIIPTYNERESLAPLVDRVLRAVPAAAVLVVDDGSPDGTGEIAEQLARTDPRITVMRRGGKSGLGSAYRAGFRWALQQERFASVVEMDADGSHAPEELPRLLAADADLVLGSRYTPGGEVANWPLRRQLLSRAGNRYARLCLGLDLTDMTGGFRVFRTSLLAALDDDRIVSEGYCFQIETVRAAMRGGFRVVEVPITFTERTAGASKMSHRIVVEALLRITGWGWRRLGGRDTSDARQAAAPALELRAAPLPATAPPPTQPFEHVR